MEYEIVKAGKLAVQWPFKLTPHNIRRSEPFEKKFDAMADYLSDDTNDALRDLESSPGFNALGTYITLDLLFNGGDALTNPGSELTDPIGNPYDLAGETGRLIYEDAAGRLLFGDTWDLPGTVFEIYGGTGDWISDPVDETRALIHGAKNSFYEAMGPFIDKEPTEYQKDQEYYDPVIDSIRSLIWGHPEYATAAAAAPAEKAWQQLDDSEKTGEEVEFEYDSDRAQYRLQIGDTERYFGDDEGETVGELASRKRRGELEKCGQLLEKQQN